MSQEGDAPLVVPVLLDAGGALPGYASAGAAGADLRASEAVEIARGARAAVATGVRLEIPPGHVGLVWPRSGLAVRHGIDTLAGVIDSDYRGELKVALVNLGAEPFRVTRGMRIAQLVFARFERVEFRPTDALPASDRGDGGFGSTGH